MDSEGDPTSVFSREKGHRKTLKHMNSPSLSCGMRTAIIVHEQFLRMKKFTQFTII